MGQSKRASGPPRRPRNPVAKAVRTPAFKQQVVPDKRREELLKDLERVEQGGQADKPDDVTGH